MQQSFFYEVSFKKQPQPENHDTTVSDDDLKLINSLNQNGPLRKLAKDEINTRAIIIMGEEPTSKMSIHPERVLQGQNVFTLSKLAKLLPGAPMMVGHRFDTSPWGRTFKAQVLSSYPKYKGAVLKEAFWFLNDDEGNAIARKIDAGIWSEGSISYWFTQARCSICHTPMATSPFLTASEKIPRCSHTLGQKDPATGQICYWYPHDIKKVGETSYVFRGAFTKTKSFLGTMHDELKTAYSDEEITAATMLEQQLVQSGLQIDSHNMRPDSNTTPSLPPQIPASDSNSTDTSQDPAPHENHTDDENSISPKKDALTPGNKQSDPPQQTDAPQTSDTTDHPAPNETPSAPDNTSHTKDSTPGQTNNPETVPHTDYLSSGSPQNNTDNPPDQPPDDSNTRGKGKGQGQPRQGDGGASKCECPSCGYLQDKTDKGTPCNETKCPKCGTKMMGKNSPPTPQEHVLICPKCGAKNTYQQLPPENTVLKCAQCSTEIPLPEGYKQVINKLSTSRTADSQKTKSETVGNNSPFSVIDKYTEGLPSHDVQLVYSVMLDPTLDSDERYVALSNLCFEDPTAAEKVITLLNYTEANELNLSLISSPALYYCPDCGDEATTPGQCQNCGESMLNIIDFNVDLFKPVGPIKPRKSGVANNEFFELEAFKKLPAGTYYVEPKYDGVWMELHRKGDTVKLYTDEGNEYAHKFPGIVNEALSLEADNFIIAGEMTRWRGRKRLTHEDVTSWLHAKAEKYDDKEFRYKPFRLILFAGADVRKLPLSQTRAKLDKAIPWGKQIHPTRFREVKHAEGDDKIVNAIKDRATREGAMVKSVESRYLKVDEKLLWKWKKQYHVDALVIELQEKKGGGNVYTCEVGRGKEATVIGNTYATKITAIVGQIITVSVDSVRYDPDTAKYSWIAPKVVALRQEKKLPDPLSTLRKIADLRKKDSSYLLTLTEILPKLKRAPVDVVFYLTGGLVENGYTQHDIDIVTTTPLTDAQLSALQDALGPDLAQALDITCDPDGPAGPNILIQTDMQEKAGAWKYSNRFVLQEHGWGKKKHYDLRFGAPKTPRMWGWTCFSMPPLEAGGRKTRCQEKKYHDIKWMDVSTKKIAPGEPGNPTKNLNAWMIKIDGGEYEYITRKPKFLEMVLHGKKLKGRYVWREIEVPKTKHALKASPVEGDEVGTKTEKIWVMWKPKDQEVNSPIKKLAYRYIANCLFFWESDDDDTAVND